jgi:hypothetical protein
MTFFPLRQFLCLINQHNRDIVFDFVQEFALIADQAISRFIQAEVTLALRAYQNIQQFFAYGQFLPSLVIPAISIL